MDSKQFMPEDGMTIQFSLIMLHGKQKSGKTLMQEVYRGGCVDSGDIPNMPEVKDFIEKCKEGETITVDNFSYELCGEDYHTRDAAYEEIAEIIVDGFPFNYGGDILHNISHEGPEQFQIQNKEIYTEGGYQKMDEKEVEPEDDLEQ